VEREIAIAREAAEKRAAEAEESRRILDAIMEYVPEGLAIADSEGKVTRSSAYGDDLSGIPKESLEGSTVRERRQRMRFYKPDGITPASDEDMPIMKVLLTGEPVKNRELAIKRRDGRQIPILSSAGPIKDKAGALRGVVHVWRDITELKRVEEERERIISELKRSNQELQQFAYVASHDLQEPLRTVASYVELLAMKYKGKLDEKADKYISFAVQGANRMSELINDLLAFSRVGTRSGPFKRLSMDEALDRALSNLRKSIRESGAAITRDAMPEVIGDHSQLSQLFQNLIANALKFRKESKLPKIHVSAEHRGNEWIFGVHDEGIGIEPRFYERIFTIFQRLHTKEEYPGTGVGLAIAKRIVERHGGRIWVESKPGEGSSFYFTLPAGVSAAGG
jgi:PAS domain S-box-containing protein